MPLNLSPAVDAHFQHLQHEHGETDADHTGQEGEHHTLGENLLHDVA
jgi:hypothetical protein